MADSADNDVDRGTPEETQQDAADAPKSADTNKPVEIGGYDGPEPTRFGDWEKAGRCIDF